MHRRFQFRSGAGITLVAALAALIALSVPALDAQGQTLPLPVEERPVHLLKAEYLACDRASMQTALSPGTAAYCSMVSEALLRRAFDGDHERLLAWWRTERHAVQGQAGR